MSTDYPTPQKLVGIVARNSLAARLHTSDSTSLADSCYSRDMTIKKNQKPTVDYQARIGIAELRTEIMKMEQANGPLWHGALGTIRMRDMTDAHLANAIKLMEDRAAGRRTFTGVLAMNENNKLVELRSEQSRRRATAVADKTKWDPQAGRWVTEEKGKDPVPYHADKASVDLLKDHIETLVKERKDLQQNVESLRVARTCLLNDLKAAQETIRVNNETADRDLKAAELINENLGKELKAAKERIAVLESTFQEPTTVAYWKKMATVRLDDIIRLRKKIQRLES